ncbi:hypothetical protein SDC9_111593 [bioreactor metagenome]|uniref:Uncharacterized protein n=1 Tax=bioreactor metagenome TaxID=1076179 RepID=A0A645BH61_9ZZZZ
MADGEAVVASRRLDERTHQVRGNDHVQRGEDRCKSDQTEALHPRIHTGCDEYEWEPIKHMAGEEHALPLRKAGDQQVDDECNNHDDTDLRAVLSADINGGRGDGLGHDRAKRGRKPADHFGYDADAAIQHKESDGGHKRSANDFTDVLLLDNQADHRDHCKENCALTKDFFYNKV